VNSFLIGLQFLSRIHLVKQTEWSAEGFGKSVKYFSLVGAIMGACLAIFAFILYYLLPQQGIALPVHIRAFLIIFFWIALTGGLHCDGFMDTMDGIFSGRDREKMLVIMKDSCVGANGVTAFVMLVLAKWSILLDMPQEKILGALFAAPMIARMGMVMAITLFPYARREGMGKAFSQYADKKACLTALLIMLLFIFPIGIKGYIIAAAALVFAYFFNGYIKKILGGVTGDTYGAVTEITEAIVIGLFLI
jgi:adenosylcobinamide-GDP ribazoletransferase